MQYLLTLSKLDLATSCEFNIYFKSLQFYKFGSTIHNNYYIDMKMSTLIIHDITEKFKEHDKHNFVVPSSTQGLLPSHSPVQRAAIGSTGQA